MIAAHQPCISESSRLLVPESGRDRIERSDACSEWARRFNDDLRRAEQRLREWRRDPSVLEDDDTIAPSIIVIDRAMEVSKRLRALAMDRVAPRGALLLNLRGVAAGPDGEICFEFEKGPIAMTTRVEPDGTVVQLSFMGDDLIHSAQVLDAPF